LVRIIDGDTIVVDIDLGCNQWTKAEHVRLLGINAPEVRGSDKEFGRDSRDYLACLLPEPGGDVIIHTQKDGRGSFNRLLADIYVDSQHVNARMVEDGFAEVSQQ
jgi:micrococcal nuclease